MKTVKEVADLSGVSIRTLHHYDAIGLLLPTRKTKAGYRLYDDTAISKLQMILLYRELEFSLSEIKQILDFPDFDRKKALEQQIVLLKLRKQQINRLISLAEQMITEGQTMDFKPFEKTVEKDYRDEVMERWGKTNAYAQYKAKQEKGELPQNGEESLMQCFAVLGRLKHLQPADPLVQKEIASLQALITEQYYECTKPILLCLGQMYASDERFQKNIDAMGGEGTAAFAEQAITVYCKNE